MSRKRGRHGTRTPKIRTDQGDRGSAVAEGGGAHHHSPDPARRCQCRGTRTGDQVRPGVRRAAAQGGECRRPQRRAPRRRRCRCHQGARPGGRARSGAQLFSGLGIPRGKLHGVRLRPLLEPVAADRSRLSGNRTADRLRRPGRGLLLRPAVRCRSAGARHAASRGLRPPARRIGRSRRRSRSRGAPAARGSDVPALPRRSDSLDADRLGIAAATDRSPLLSCAAGWRQACRRVADGPADRRCRAGRAHRRSLPARRAAG